MWKTRLLTAALIGTIGLSSAFAANPKPASHSKPAATRPATHAAAPAQPAHQPKYQPAIPNHTAPAYTPPRYTPPAAGRHPSPPPVDMPRYTPPGHRLTPPPIVSVAPRGGYLPPIIIQSQRSTPPVTFVPLLPPTVVVIPSSRGTAPAFIPTVPPSPPVVVVQPSDRGIKTPPATEALAALPRTTNPRVLRDLAPEQILGAQGLIDSGKLSIDAEAALGRGLTGEPLTDDERDILKNEVLNNPNLTTDERARINEVLQNDASEKKKQAITDLLGALVNRLAGGAAAGGGAEAPPAPPIEIPAASPPVVIETGPAPAASPAPTAPVADGAAAGAAAAPPVAGPDVGLLVLGAAGYAGWMLLKALGAIGKAISEGVTDLTHSISDGSRSVWFAFARRASAGRRSPTPPRSTRARATASRSAEATRSRCASTPSTPERSSARTWADGTS